MTEEHYLMFDTETKLLQEVAERYADSNVVALCPVGAYQVNIVHPNALLDDFYYKVFVISRLNVWSVLYIYSEDEIEEDFPEEDRLRVRDAVAYYFENTLMTPLHEVEINRSLYPIAEEPSTEAVVAQPQPLLFSSSDPLSPIPRSVSIDIDRMMEELKEDDINRLDL